MTTMQEHASLASVRLDDLKAHFERELHKPRVIKPTDFVSPRLERAITYALISPGKRLRPLLVLAMARACAKENPDRAVKIAMPLALSVEYLHTYSLIHDDLPAMDDDDYRRGRLALHRQFDEALAILAGDALLTDAFLLASSVGPHGALICHELALMAGSRGLVAGQAEDLNPANATASYARWLSINAAKTARLFESCAVIGALSATSDKHLIDCARAFGRAFGIAFQIKDDIEDNAGVVGRESQALVKQLLEEQRACAEKLLTVWSSDSLLAQILATTFS